MNDNGTNKWTGAGTNDWANGLTDWNPWTHHGGVDFPLNALPSVAADWARLRSAQTGADVNAFAVASLQLASGACSHNITLQPKQHESYMIRPTMWSMLVGPPGSKKSIAVSAAQQPLRALEQVYADMRRDTVAKLKKDGNTEAEKEVPPARRFIASDSTIEKLSDILSHQDSGITLIRDELSGWLNSMDRYGHSSDRAFWLESAGGGSFIVDRIKGSRHVKRLSISVFGGIQPDRLQNIGSLSVDGLFQRFLPVHMSDARAETDDPFDPDITNAFHEVIRKLAILSTITFELHTDAGAAWLGFANEMTVLSKTTVPSPAFGTFLNKQARTLGMLALLLHLMDVAPDITRSGGLAGSRVSLATLNRARKILEEFFLPHAWTFYAETTLKGEDLVNIATMLLKAANDGKLRLTLRDMTRSTQAIAKLKGDTVEVRAALTPFVANGWIAPETDAHHNHTWVLNPTLKGHLRGEMRRQVELHREIVAKITGAART